MREKGRIVSDVRPQSTSPAKRRPWWWPHLSTWTIGAAVLGIVALFNIMPDPYGDPRQDKLQWGWPQVWYRVAANDNEFALWSPGALWFDIAVGALIAGGIGTVLELRRRRRGRFFQFRLTDIFGLVLLVALVGIGPLRWYRETQGTWALREALAASDEPLHVQFVERDVPVDWLRDALHVPDDWRPETIAVVRIASGSIARARTPGGATPSAPDAWLGDLARVESIRELHLAGFQLSVSDSARVAKMPNVVELSLDACQVDGESLGALARMRSLRRLTLYQISQITDDDLRGLARLENLEEIRLIDCPGVQGIGFAHLKNLPCLESLAFYTSAGFQNDFTDEGLRNMSMLPHLKELYLSGSRAVTDAGLGHLSRLKDLEYVGISNSAITDRGLEHLSRNAKLKGFDFPGSAMTSEGEAKLRAAIERRR